MMVFLFVGLEIKLVYAEAPFLCYMIVDPADTSAKTAIDSIGNFIHFMNYTQLPMSSSERSHVSENMPYMIPVHPKKSSYLNHWVH